jgi:hypothetical protein
MQLLPHIPFFSATFVLIQQKSLERAQNHQVYAIKSAEASSVRMVLLISS